MQPRGFLHHPRHLLLPEELEDLLDLELLRVAARLYGRLLLQFPVEDLPRPRRSSARSRRRGAWTSRAVRRRVGRRLPEVRLERLDRLDPRLDDLVDRHAERLQRRLDDLLPHGRVGPRREAAEERLGLGEEVPLGGVDPRGVEDAVEVDLPSHGPRRLRDEGDGRRPGRRGRGRIPLRREGFRIRGGEGFLPPSFTTNQPRTVEPQFFFSLIKDSEFGILSSGPAGNRFWWAPS